ncbi:MAG TPA: hypothetical protein VND40_00095 [Nitrososphaerales archaeon]|nr:hypothetical protein [Nitrososphaerales archaeon]
MNITFGGGPETRAGTNAQGAFTDYITAPSAAPGVYAVSATDGENTATVDFTLGLGTVANTTTSSSTTSSNATTVTTTVTSISRTTVTTTSTTTATSLSTTTLPAVTLTSTHDYTTTGPPAAPVTTTTTLTQLATAVTVTVSASQSNPGTGTAQGAPQPSGGFSDTLLYFLAGVGILVTAISVGMVAFRDRTLKDYRTEAPSGGSTA